jgi:hypothetical protein
MGTLGSLDSNGGGCSLTLESDDCAGDARSAVPCIATMLCLGLHTDSAASIPEVSRVRNEDPASEEKGGRVGVVRSTISSSSEASAVSIRGLNDSGCTTA